MQKFFEICILITVAVTFSNGMLYVFAPSLTGETPHIEDIRVTEDDLNSVKVSQNIASGGNPLDGIWAFVTNTIGGGLQTLNVLYSFSQSYASTLKTVFGSWPLMTDFLDWTIIPVINMIQLVGISYFLIFAVSALRRAVV
jgi:hypothetical protein